MAKLHYLTVQDILWISLQATKKVQHFSYARLEEATFYQYAYGESSEILSQAGRFLAGFLKMHPLSAGNEATAFVAMVAFLKINGVSLRLEDVSAADWVARSSVSVEAAREALALVAEIDEHGHGDDKPVIRAAIQDVIRVYPTTISALTKVPVSA